jgi:DNA primase
MGDTTPEQRAAFRTKLEEAAKRIPDKALAGEYRSALLDRFFASRRRAGGGPGTATRAGDNRSAPYQAAPFRTGARPPANAKAIAAERTRILTAILLRHPALLRDVDHAYAGLDLDPPLARLREAIDDWANHTEVLDSEALMGHLDGFGLRTDVERILAGTPIPLPACASSSAMPAEAEEGWWHIFGFLNVDRLRQERNLAAQEAALHWTPESTRKVVALTEALNKVSAGDPDGTGLAAA